MTALVADGKLAELIELASAAPHGDFVEVGVYAGGSARVLYQICLARGRRLHLFDTFAGLPHKSEWDIHQVGHFSFEGMHLLKREMPRAWIYKGVFPETLPGDLHNVAFVHEDVDQYQSVKDVIERLYPRLVDGGMILFDDYFTADCPGAKKAIDECGHALHRGKEHVYVMKGRG